jgi:hypothetical protein
MRIQNPRIERDLAALAVLKDADAVQSAGELRHGLKQNMVQGVHPQAIIDLETEGFAVFLSWAACRADGSFDAYFVPTALLRGVTMQSIDWRRLRRLFN